MANAVIGALRVNLGLDSANFDNGLKKANAGAQRTAKRLGVLGAAGRELSGSLSGVSAQAGGFARLAGSLGVIGVALGAAAGGAVLLAREAKKAVAVIADIGDAAARAQIDAGLFEGLKAALTLEGQDDSGLESALTRFSKALGEAKQGEKSAIEAFKRVGVSIDDVAKKGLTSEDVLFKVADGLAAIDDPARRAAASQDILGRSAGAVTTVLQKGSEATRETIAEADKLGLLYGGELIRTAGELNIAFDRQAKVIDVQLKKAFIQAAPAVADLGESMVQIIPVIAEVIAAASAGLSELLALIGVAQRPIRVQLATNIEELRQVQDEIARRATESESASLAQRVGAVLPDVPDFVRRAIDPIGIADTSRPFANAGRAELEALQADLIERNRLIGEQLAAEDRLFERPEIVPFTPPGGGSAKKPKTDDSAVNLLAGLRERIQLQTEELALVGLEGVAREQAIARFEREAAVRDLLAASRKEGATITADEIEQGKALALVIEDQTLRLFDQEEAWRRTQEAQRDMTEDMDRLQSAGADALAGLLTGTLSWREALVGVLQTLIQIASQGLTGLTNGGSGGLLGSLIGFAGSAIGGAFGGGFTGSLSNSGNAFGAAGSLFTGSGAIALPKFADGGFVPGGTLALVGERGPEPVLFGRDARVLSNEDFRGALSDRRGGGDRILNMTVVTQDAGSFVRSKAQVAAAAADAQQRAGFFR